MNRFCRRGAIDRSLCCDIHVLTAEPGASRIERVDTTESARAARRSDAQRSGQGLGKWLIEQVLAHPDLLDLRRFMLVTRDAAGLYARYGFQSPVDPSGTMQIRRPDPYAHEQRTARPSTLEDSRVNGRDDG